MRTFRVIAIVSFILCLPATAVGAGVLDLSFAEIQATLRARLSVAPAWFWVAAAAGFLLFIGSVAGLVRLRRPPRREPFFRSNPDEFDVSAVYYNPRDFRRRRPVDWSSTSTPFDRLLCACDGDRSRMARLMDYERSRAPRITDAEAAQRALDRLLRDRN